jgi:predicted esterase
MIEETYSQSTNSVNNELIGKYLQADEKGKEKIAKEMIRQKPDFDLVYSQIKQGKHYRTDVPKGFCEHQYTNRIGVEHPNLVFVPYKYTPEKKYPVRVFLHGGVSTLEIGHWVNSINRTDTTWNSVNAINLYPAAWAMSKWWSYSQYENISNLLRFVKDEYNIDENQISVTGVSDGGTGIYYLSNFYQDPFSCFLPFIGSMETLAYIKDKQFYIRNYQGLSFFIVNGKKDEIFNFDYVRSSVNELKNEAKEVKFFAIDSAKHNTNWHPVLKDSIKNFIATHTRNPFPDEVCFCTEKPDTFNRKFWVVINQIGKVYSGNVDDPNTIVLRNQTVTMFPRRKPFGQIKVEKKGNTVYATTSNIKEFTLLISPEHFDLERPIQVYTNNELSFNAQVTKDLKTLLKYNILDNDRSMLFSDELKVKVGKSIK